MFAKSSATTSKRLSAQVAAWLFATSLTGCSGSTDAAMTASVDSTPANTSQANSAPSFPNGTRISLSENTLAVATASAVDADRDALTYRISGGADATLFSIAPNTGLITFNKSPDFERPEDSDKDNIYNLDVSVTDGRGGAASASYAITIVNIPDERYVEEIFTGTVISEDLVYARVNGRDLVLNVISPAGDATADRPFVLLATGGAFAFTNRSWSIPIAERFVRAGYVAAVMDYRTRGAPVSGNDFRIAALEATHDMYAAVRYIRSRAPALGVNPDKIVVGGTSAGAMMAIAAGTMDPGDPMTDEFIALLGTMGGLYGNVGDHLQQSSSVQGVYAISGAVFGRETIDANSAVIYGVHNELDGVAPCRTVAMSEPQLVVSGTISGTCDFMPVFEARGVAAGSFIVPGDTEHVDFTDEEWAEFTTEALVLFKREILDID